MISANLKPEVTDSESRIFFWEAGEDPKYLKCLPKAACEEYAAGEDNVIIWRLIWFLGVCVGEDFYKMSDRMIDGIVARDDVREFFHAYLKWRTRAEEWIAGWPWNMEPNEVEEFRLELNALLDLEERTSTQNTLVDFLRTVVPDVKHPYYNDDLRENGSDHEREVEVEKWRKLRSEQLRKAIGGVGRRVEGSQS
jgi:hypothetical protein